MSALRGSVAAELEQGLIASCWQDADNAKIVLGTMSAEDFHTPSGSLQFRVMRQCWRQYKTVEVHSLKKISADRGLPESFEVVWEQWKTGRWTGYGPNHLRSLMDQVKDETGRHRFKQALESGLKALEDPHIPFPETRAKLGADLQTAAMLTRKSNAEHWKDGLGQLAERIRERQAEEAAGRRVVETMSTGLEPLDEVMGGLGESELIILAARPRVGKTAKGLQWATHVAEAYGPTLFLSLELSRRKMWARVACQRLQVDLKTMYDRPDLVETVRDQNVNLYIEDEPVRPDHLLQRIELFRLEHPDLKAVFLDHLGILAGDGADYKSTSYASNKCRAAMKATGLPFVVMVQIGRKADENSGGRPKLSDLKMSGCIEEDARKVVLLHRPPLYRKQGQGDPFEALAIVAKNGEGQEGDVPLHYNGPTFTFKPAPKKSDQAEKTPGKDFPISADAPEFEEQEINWEGVY